MSKSLLCVHHWMIEDDMGYLTSRAKCKYCKNKAVFYNFVRPNFDQYNKDIKLITKITQEERSFIW